MGENKLERQPKETMFYKIYIANSNDFMIII